ncbi:MAG: alpha-L-fucosidase [Prevotellaceae bacterium]|jgi:alpha-L-fucosidase|nr:alpha-L-fucosidase [Prevotellaceae bacterium]
MYKHTIFFIFLLCATEHAYSQNLSKSEKTVLSETEREKTLRLPKSDAHYMEISRYIEDEPDSDYRHASEAAYESFRDIKFSIRIIWGVYSKWGIEASWPMLDMPAEKKQEYQNLYKTFNPVKFDANEWMKFFKRSGIQAFALITKHHDGFSLWHTKTRVKQRANFLNPTENVIEPCDLAYSIEDTPFKRDIVKELCDAAHKRGIKIDLYFSHPDWYDADFRPYNYHPLATPDILEHPENYYNPNIHGYNNRKVIPTPETTPEERQRMVARHREQIHELLTNYGKVDMMCFDQWLSKDNWPDLKKTIKLARKWSPETMFRARGIGNYGDYYQPEQFVPKGAESSGMPWMSICLLGNNFSYDPVAEHYKGARWIIRNLIDCVAKGGSFMVCVSPDEFGEFHPKAVEQLEEVGQWLKINGNGIYETRAREEWKSGDFYFTRSKDSKTLYAFTEKWTDGEIIIPSITPRKGSKAYLFGNKKPLKWTQTADGVRIKMPAGKPCEYAWGFQFEVD